MLLVGEETAGSNTELVTGTRTWRMADGTSKRLRFTGFSKNPKYGNFQNVNPSAGGMAFSDFAREEQPKFNAFRTGEIKLAAIPGLDMRPNFPTGKLPKWMLEEPIFWLGETRLWENSAGKKVMARLACLTDEDVSLLIGDSASRVSLQDLSQTDMNYLQELKVGKKRTYPTKVISGANAWDGGKSYCVSISGENYVALANLGSNFDEALNSAIKHVRSQLEISKLDVNMLDFNSFTETLWLPPRATYLCDVKNIDPKNEKRPFFYVAEFFIHKSAQSEMQRIWPMQMSPKSWRGTPTLLVYVTADGTTLKAEELIHTSP